MKKTMNIEVDILNIHCENTLKIDVIHETYTLKAASYFCGLLKEYSFMSYILTSSVIHM